ncbi:helix-turn-helix domain-containing protein [Gluconacetobacter azotocaptans]|uniref:Helix-turn-helix domain-containing protein n=2 Tax=Gluconacetobacter azotocaptans TaxID=142834 RepID=A0A7W4JPX3_9PROT|nr:helix-turn-helix transcriptional regulator [Gluconacetobacter azotocaptans]MBB2188632.1 helix-turn-helix domain-containing protein [Gluconacetobacter azotocaptans]MBM9400336.1 helix-turn-helix domain-containing protein [Gluconacetobacter azotocaptans]GBQ35286.1 putative transcriptional regulator [Gluconacetobacter azotocaptans DSM 13594]
MPIAPDQRPVLGAFLRARREALPPERAGVMRVSARRRTPGLRREEVAQLCGISTTWYTWAEQGRDITLSAPTLGRLADALRLSPAERAYLFELTRQKDPRPPDPAGAESLPPDLTRLPELIDAPAYLLDRLWCVRAANARARHLFTGWLAGPEPNLLRYVFLDPAARTFLEDWDDRAHRILAEFRADTARLADDPALERIVAALLRDSPDFARFWTGHAVLSRAGGPRRFMHPQDGLLVHDQITLIPAGHPDYKLVVLPPGDG